MKIFKNHGLVLLLIFTSVFAAFGDLTTTPLWDGQDAQIISDAHRLAADPEPMFRHLGFYFSQPLLQLVFLAEHQAFGPDVAGYIFVNLAIHAFNAFMVYMLVHMLFPRRSMAVVAAVAFALGVGSYGRVFMTVHSLESLLLAGLHLLSLYCFIRNDFRNQGAVRSPLFLVGVLVFLAAGLTKTSSFALISCLVAYKVFFHERRGRPVLSPDLLLFMAVAVLFHLGESRWGYDQPTIFGDSGENFRFSVLSIKNLFRYLTLMFFPMQSSPILDSVPVWVRWIYEMRTVIRFAIAIAIVSYSFFGLVFGSRALRFFIAWTFITLVPFTAHTASGQWLNLSHLYLASLGFCVILAAGASGCSNLLKQAGMRRFAPYLVPVMLAAVSISLTHRLDHRNKMRASWPESQQLRQDLLREYGMEPDTGPGATADPLR